MLTKIRIDNRMNGFLGTPGGVGKKPVVIHLHERYGIVQHTTDLGQKFVDAGYLTIVPDFFSRFAGDREVKFSRGATIGANSATRKFCSTSMPSSRFCARFRKRI
jgi:dienelactone hydrolase